ncbi:hypothetical protein EDD15DRAFT_2477587 [Pisolithus albus]|nr:hypothetical protein EDD15DRAFT_2477587 [Pisolithus albus]
MLRDNSPRRPPSGIILPPFDEVEDGPDPSTLHSQPNNFQVVTSTRNSVSFLANPSPPVGDPFLSDDLLLSLANDFGPEFTLPLPVSPIDFDFFSFSPTFPPYSPTDDTAEYSDLSMLFQNEVGASPPAHNTDEQSNTSSDGSMDETVVEPHSPELASNEMAAASYYQAYTSMSPMDTAADDINAEALPSGAGDSQHEPTPEVPPPTPPPTPRSARGRKVPWSEGNTPPDPSRTAQCTECGRWFVRAEHLKRHTASLHSDEKPYACEFPDCNKTFSRRDNCKYHYKAHFKPPKEKQEPDEKQEKEEPKKA